MKKIYKKPTLNIFEFISKNISFLSGRLNEIEEETDEVIDWSQIFN